MKKNDGSKGDWIIYAMLGLSLAVIATVIIITATKLLCLLGVEKMCMMALL